MAWKSTVRIAFVIFGTVFLTMIAGLATEAAGNEAQWPRPLHYIQNSPWWVLVVIALILIALGVLQWRMSEATSNKDDPPNAIDLSNPTFHGPVTINQGDIALGSPAQESGDSPAQPEAFERAAPSGDSDGREHSARPVILYFISSWLDDGRWEETALKLVRERNPDAPFVPLNEKNATRSDVVVVIVVFSAGQRNSVKTPTLAKLRLANSLCPNVRLILIAAGFSDPPIEDKDGHHWLKLAGYNADHDVRFLKCRTEEDFESGLSSHLSVALDVGSMQLLLDQDGDQPRIPREDVL